MKINVLEPEEKIINGKVSPYYFEKEQGWLFELTR